MRAGVHLLSAPDLRDDMMTWDVLDYLLTSLLSNWLSNRRSLVARVTCAKNRHCGIPFGVSSLPSLTQWSLKGVRTGVPRAYHCRSYYQLRVLRIKTTTDNTSRS